MKADKSQLLSSLALIMFASAAGGLATMAIHAQSVPLPEAVADQSYVERRARLVRLAQGTMAKFHFADEKKPTADLKIPSLDGAPRPLSSWRGKTVLIHFWASWCAACQTEIPDIARLEARLGDPAFSVFTLSLDKSPENAKHFLDGLGVPSLPLGIDPEGDSVAKRLGAKGLPTSILIGPDGQEIGRIEGSVPWLSDDAILFLMTVLQDSRE